MLVVLPVNLKHILRLCGNLAEFKYWLRAGKGSKHSVWRDAGALLSGMTHAHSHTQAVKTFSQAALVSWLQNLKTTRTCLDVLKIKNIIK